MGYAVYEDRESPGRWAGYGVPAECDFPGCAAKIDRGLAYKCEEHLWYDGDGDDHLDEGCGLYFCSEHRYDATMHDNIEPKPDTRVWVWHMLTDISWHEWRMEHLEKTHELWGRFFAGRPEEAP